MKLCSNVQRQTIVFPPKNNETWQLEFPLCSVRGPLQCAQPPPDSQSSESCLAHIITLFMFAVGRVCRDTANTSVQLSVQTWGADEIFSRLIVSKLQKGGESIKDNAGFSPSLRPPVGAPWQKPPRDIGSFALACEERVKKKEKKPHQSFFFFFLMFELISREHLQNKKIWCCLWETRPSEIPRGEPCLKSMFLKNAFQQPSNKLQPSITWRVSRLQNPAVWSPHHIFLFLISSSVPTVGKKKLTLKI